MTRKHIQTYRTVIGIATDDVDRLHELLSQRSERNDHDKLRFGLRDDAVDLSDLDYLGEAAPGEQGWVWFKVAYGPVRGANRTDVDRALERLHANGVRLFWAEEHNAVEYHCTCSNRMSSCRDETTDY